MKMSMRKNLAILLLSGTTALAGPAFAQQADPANPLLVPEGQGQGSTQTEGSTDTNAGSAEGSADTNSQVQTPDGVAAEQNSAQGSGSANGETETQTSDKPADGKADQDAAQATDGTATNKIDRQTTAEGGDATSDGTTTDNARSTNESETKSQTSAGASSSEETDESAQSAPSNETTASIDITTEQRTEIHNVIKESDARPVDIDIDVTVGTVVPRTVELLPLPPRIIEIVPAYRAYKYILLANGTILIIEPASLKVVYVIAA